MIKPTIADAGILVALIDDYDFWHDWATAQAAQLTPPFLTCETAIAEASHLLKSVKRAQEKLLGFVSGGFLKIDFSLSDEAGAIEKLMKKYEDVPMDLADACLVRMCELNDAAMVFTLDSDFWIYRKNGKELIPLIIPARS